MKKTIQTLAIAAIATASVTAMAARDGQVSATNSNGDFLITFNAGSRIVVKNFNDMTLTTDGATPGQPIVGYEDVCVGKIGAVTGFTVELDSATAGANTGNYELNGSTETIAYNVEFANDVSTTVGNGSDPDGSGNVAGPFSSLDSIACGTDNSRIIVSVPSTSWETAVDTVYTDTLTVTVTPQ